MTQAQQLADLSQAYTAGALGGFRNRLINGGPMVLSRPAATLVPGAPIYGGPDRWRMVNSTGVSTSFKQDAGTITAGGVAMPAVVQTVVTPVTDLSGTNTWQGINQVLEGYNVYDLKGAAIAFSTWFLTNVSGLYAIAVRDSTPTVSYVTTFSAVAGTPVKVTFYAPGNSALVIPASNAPGLYLCIGALNAGSLVAPSLNTWVAGSYTAAAGTVNWGAAANNFISISEPQLEVGSICTPFERRGITLEMLLCMRYRQQNYIVNYGTLTKATDTYRTWTVQFMTSMRVAPAILATLSSGSLSIVASGVNGFTGNINIGDTTTTVQMTGWSAEAEL